MPFFSSTDPFDEDDGAGALVSAARDLAGGATDFAAGSGRASAALASGREEPRVAHFWRGSKVSSNGARSFLRSTSRVTRVPGWEVHHSQTSWFIWSVPFSWPMRRMR